MLVNGVGVGVPFPVLGRTQVVGSSSLLVGLVSYWKLDETTGTRVDAVGSSNLTTNNAVGFAAGKIGNAASFVRGSSQALTGTISLAQGATFTIAGWLLYTEASNANFLRELSTDNGSAAAESFLIFNNVTAHQMTFRVNDSVSGNAAVALAVDPTHFVDGVFNHCIATYTSSDKKLTVYLNNGSGNASSALTNGVAASSRIALGAQVDLTNPSTCQWDEVGLWNRALTTAERSALYNAGAGKAYPF